MLERMSAARGGGDRGRMIKWHPPLHRHGSGQTQAYSEVQGSLASAVQGPQRARHDLATEQQQLLQIFVLLSEVFYHF